MMMRPGICQKRSCHSIDLWLVSYCGMPGALYQRYTSRPSARALRAPRLGDLIELRKFASRYHGHTAQIRFPRINDYRMLDFLVYVDA
eukprot:4193137-Amphidinium_carterae.3